VKLNTSRFAFYDFRNLTLYVSRFTLYVFSLSFILEPLTYSSLTVWRVSAIL